MHVTFVGRFFGSAELVEVMLQVTCLAPRSAASVSVKHSSIPYRLAPIRYFQLSSLQKRCLIISQIWGVVEIFCKFLKKSGCVFAFFQSYNIEAVVACVLTGSYDLF